MRTRWTLRFLETDTETLGDTSTPFGVIDADIAQGSTVAPDRESTLCCEVSSGRGK